MESKKHQKDWRILTVVLVTAGVATITVLGYLGTQHPKSPVVQTLAAPIRNLAETSCGVRTLSKTVTDIFSKFQSNKTHALSRGPSLQKSKIRILREKSRTDDIGLQSLEKRVEDLLDNMELEDQIGQILQPENTNAKCYEISDSKVGSVFFGGNDNPGAWNSPMRDTPMAWHERANEIQEEAVGTAPHHIPVFVGVDTIHGMSHMINATLFPHNIALGCTRNPKLVEEIGRITATESVIADVNWGFAPCVALATDIRWGRIYESFGQDPDLVGRLGAAYVKGAKQVKKPFVTCGKHFVGDGGARYGTGRAGRPVDRGDWKGSMEELRETHMKPYEYLVKAGVGSIMASYSSVNGSLMHGATNLIQDELKGRMGFKGFVSSDYNAINGLDNDYTKAVTKAINAGVDQIMLGPANGANHPYPGQLGKIIAKNVEKGDITKERVRDAAKRVLLAKYESGLMDHHDKKASFARVDSKDKAKADLTAQLALIGQAKHRAVARQAVQEATVVLENHHHVLPLNVKEQKVCVIGTAANDAGSMLGGWTLNWQSHTGDVETPATTVWTGVEALAKIEGVPDNVKYVSHNKPQDCKGSDVALVVIAEAPYAEFEGDRTAMPRLNQAALAAQIKKHVGIPVVLLATPGRPVDVEKAVEDASAFVVSFLPGSEGGLGITDVLFGKVAPKGKLSMDWPKSGHALVRIVEDKTLLYKYGDGLSWKV